MRFKLACASSIWSQSSLYDYVINKYPGTNRFSILEETYTKNFTKPVKQVLPDGTIDLIEVPTEIEVTDTYIDINNLTDLLEFKDTVGGEIIIENNNKLIIYDDYVE